MAVKSVFIFLLALPSFSYGRIQGGEDSVQASSPLALHPNRITFDVGMFPRGSTGDGWEPQYALRVGFGRQVRHGLILIGHLEYYEFNIERQGDHTQLVPKSARRYDIAVYAGILMFGTVDIGLGGYYTKADPVTMVGAGGHEEPWFAGGLSTIRLLATFGIQHEFEIVDGLFLPIGVYYRDIDNGNAWFFLRLGLGMKF
jgi:hypothetical protein